MIGTKMAATGPEPLSANSTGTACTYIYIASRSGICKYGEVTLLASQKPSLLDEIAGKRY